MIRPQTDIVVMPGLGPGIHVFRLEDADKTWVAGTSPAMTKAQWVG